MSTATERMSGMTWDEYLALPYETRNAALIDGEMVVNSPNDRHELGVHNLAFVFRRWIHGGSGRGWFSTQQPVKINDRNGYQPDFMWYPQEQCLPPGHEHLVTGTPRLIVEVLSPSTRRHDLVRKRSDFEKIGIPELWFVDPQRPPYSMTVCQRPEAGAPYKCIALDLDDRITSSLLPGFDIRVAELFEV